MDGSIDERFKTGKSPEGRSFYLPFPLITKEG
jgi:hypothetical protein